MTNDADIVIKSLQNLLLAGVLACKSRPYISNKIIVNMISVVYLDLEAANKSKPVHEQAIMWAPVILVEKSYAD